MPYSRRILHCAPGPDDVVEVLSERAVAGAWFELHRQGGCGAGELRLRDEFGLRGGIDVGDWIAFEYDTDDRWYLGRVESRQASSPAGIVLRLQGMSAELAEIFPGGFGRGVGDGAPPHRYARTDLFSADPDHSEETVDPVSQPQQAVRLLMSQYIVPRTHITYDPAQVEDPADPASVVSLKFRGEESAQAILRELALRARGASWGVDATGTFYFLQPRATVLATWREGRDLVTLRESRDRQLLYNRILLTGDYIYNAAEVSGAVARAAWRWRGNYVDPVSRDTYGERRIRLWVPWIRTSADSQAFVQEFFRIYATPPTRYLIEVANQSFLPRPWDGTIRVQASDGTNLATAAVESIRVQFDHAPQLRLEIGPRDPHESWPEPPQDERYVIPVGVRVSSGLPTSSSSPAPSSSAGGTTAP